MLPQLFMFNNGGNSMYAKHAFLALAIVTVVAVGCSHENQDPDSVVPDPGWSGDTFSKRVGDGNFNLPAVQPCAVYPVDIYAALHNEMIEYGMDQGYTYEQFWNEMPAIIDSLFAQFYVYPPVSGYDAAVALADILGGPYSWRNKTHEELGASTVATWNEPALQLDRSEAIKSELESIMASAMDGEDPIPRLEQLRLVADQSTSQADRNAVGNALGSAYFWSERLEQPTWVGDWMFGFALDTVIGKLIPSPFGFIIGAMASFQYALYCAQPAAPEFTWGGVGHWGTHYKAKS